MFGFFSDEAAGAVALTVVTRRELPAWRERHAQHTEWLATAGFAGEPGDFVVLPPERGQSPRVLAVAGEGASVWSLAGLPAALPVGRYAIEASDALSATDAALGWALGSYQFAAYKTPKRPPATLIWPRAADRGEIERVAAAVFLARDLINTPAADMGPAQLAAQAGAVAARHGARLDVIEGAALLAAGYPAIHAVGRASDRAPRLIDLRWGDDGAPRVTLVGKGVCFDTGGLDIKTHDGMLEMKKDMGGAAVVIGLADALMAAALPIRLRVLIPAVDNAIAGNAMRPRDILRTRGGKTVEIGNTDAEGRLILCDALAEAAAESPELLIDCATLTGAAKVALGTELQALFCDDDIASADLLAAAAAVGDPLWRLPIWRGYRKMIDSPCADLNNVGKGQFGGAIIAALYLAEFVAGASVWMHLDIFAGNAGTRPGRPEGGEATGLRALLAYLHRRYG